MKDEFDSDIKRTDALEPTVIKPNLKWPLGIIIKAVFLCLVWIMLGGTILLGGFRELRIHPQDSYTLTSMVLAGIAFPSLLGLFVWGMLHLPTITINLFQEKISFTGISPKPVEFFYSQIEWLQITKVLQGRNVVSELEIVGTNREGEEQRFAISTKAYELSNLILLIQTSLKHNPNIQLDERAQLLRDGKPLPD